MSKTLEPKSSASTNFATLANFQAGHINKKAIHKADIS